MNEQLFSAAEAALRKADLLRPSVTLLVALSGGADSVVLLRTLCGLAPTYGLTVRAAHVEHGLRGEASQRDARFCEALCGELSVPFSCDHATLSGGMDDPGAEARARDARYALLLARAKACGADALVLAHHRDDQAETVLSRLTRGSGARGLTGMREQTIREGVMILRPFLSVSKRELTDALGSLPHCEDETNALPCCQRNRLRAEVLPLLTMENPRAAEHIAQSARLLALDEDCLMAQAERLSTRALCMVPPFFYAEKALLRTAPDAVALRALRFFAEQGMAQALSGRTSQDGTTSPDSEAALPEEHSLSAPDSLRLLALLTAPDGETLNLPAGLKALVTPRHVHLVRMADGSPLHAVPTPAPQAGLSSRARVRFGGLTFRFTPCAPGESPAPDGLRSIVLPSATLTRAVLRTAQPGDRIRPFGAPGGKPLRRYWIDHKVDLPFRAFIPLLCVDDEVLWATGAGASEATRRTEAPSVRIEITGRMPWLPPDQRKSSK
ncbi:MAG TPA: tRNA lysidine(34) synthetase TilS [Candidatus Limiplasma sp.]|nr:tRNA lysidine(34) synthetase TilS [Candidatus Limiplasma sp.]HPR77689.1 tRNA lysidine(34) synthetase TilS [Candidatus Limiplasma sp.]